MTKSYKKEIEEMVEWKKKWLSKMIRDEEIKNGAANRIRKKSFVSRKKGE